MKKLISILILSLITLACTFGLVACGECEHSFTNYVSNNNATCESDGTKTAVCNKGCGVTDTVADTDSKLGHVFTNYVSDNNATYEADGTKTAVCDNNCGKTHTVTDEGSKLQKIITYNVTFEGINAPQTIEEGSLATIPEMEPTKAGYTFSGWDFDFNTKITENTNISAIWTTNNNTQYKIEYYYENIENNGYTKVESETEEKQGTTDTVVSETPKIVEHFTLDSNLSTLSGNLNGYGSLVLKVYYKRNIYTVTFNADGGNRTGGGALTQTIKYGASVTAPTLIKTGFTFDGFDKEFNNVSANLTVTVKWKINQYTLTIVGTAEKKITGDYNSEIAGIEEPKRGGYTFAGWDKQIPSKMPAQNITITAKWSAIFTHSNTINGLTSHGKTLTEIEIPESIDGIKIAAIGYEAFYNCSKLTSVTIGNSVTSIGSYAFSGCSSLTSIRIPDSVTRIGRSAFSDCSSLQYNVDGELKYLGNEQNKYLCLVGTTSTNITTATINSNCKIIGDSAFYGCSSLQYNVDGELKYLGNEQNKYLYLAGATSTDISTATINSNCKFIGNSAFSNCDSLTSVTIPNSVTSIGCYAFAWCNSLTIYCEATVKPSGWWDSYWNYSSSPVVWDCNNNDVATDGYIYTIVDGVRYSIKDGVATVAKQPKNITTANIPSSITYKENIYSARSIGSGAFDECDSLISVTIGNGVTSIGYRAFSGCDSLTSVTIPNSVTSIDKYAFSSCGSLTIYCEATAKPSGWSSFWNLSGCQVVWGYKG